MEYPFLSNGSEILPENYISTQMEENERLSEIGQVAETQQEIDMENIDEQFIDIEINQLEEYDECADIESVQTADVPQEADGEAVSNEKTVTQKNKNPTIRFKLLGNKAELIQAFKTNKVATSCREMRQLARLFAKLHKNWLLYNPTSKKWYYYDTTRWIKDEDNLIVERYAQRFFEILSSYSKNLNDEYVFYKKIRSYETYDKIKGFINLSRSHCSVETKNFNSNQMLFNCLNGTFDFSTYTFREHKPDDYITKISNVRYNPLAVSDDFIKFVHEIMSDNEGKYSEVEIIERVEFLQKILGYSLTGETNLDKCFFLYGATTRNGKSTLMENYYYLDGGTEGYGIHVAPETLAQNKRKGGQASEDLARLDGSRFAVASELPKYMYLDSAQLKQFTGGDTITARFLYGSTYEFTPRFKLFFNTNHLPYVTDDTVFSSNRIIVIPFERHFSEEEQDLGLKNRLKEEENISRMIILLRLVM